MKEKELLSKLENLLNEKYEPILVIQLLRVPPQEELQAFAKSLSEQFGYKVLVLPGDIETKVELISVLKTDVKKVEDLTNRVLDLIGNLEKEYKDVLMPIDNDDEKN
jgi:Icc-related predicted phosphoesterase